MTLPLLDSVRRTQLAAAAPAPRLVRFRQQGSFRLAPDRPWIPFTARQEVSPTRTSFSWHARMGASRLGRIHVEDAYALGRGRLRAKLWGVVPVMSARGEAVDRGELLRYLAELPWCPYAWIANPELSFSSPEPGVLTVRAGDDADAASVSFEVDGEGHPHIARALRPRQEGKEVVARRWRGTFTGWARRGDVVLPTRGEVAWLLPEAPFLYFRGEITHWDAVA